MVGHEFCYQAAKQGLTVRYQVTVFGDEARPAYDRIRLTDAIAGKDPEELLLHTPSWYEQQGMTLRSDCKVETIHRDSKTVTLADGSTLGYDKLILATGSHPYIPPIPGADLPKVFSYRDLDDAERIKQATSNGQRVTIIGGGLLGLELAKTLGDRGCAVHILERSPGVMIRQLNVVAAGMLKDRLEELGLTVSLNTSCHRITAHDDGSLQCELNTQQTLDTDVIVIATGIRSRDGLAKAAEINCSISGGVVIDDTCSSSDPNIFAIGECANHRGTVYGLAAPGYQMASVVAKRLAGFHKERFTGSDLTTKLKLAGVDVWTIGEYQADGDVSSYRVGETYRQLVSRNGHLVGATLLGPCDDLALIQDAIARNLRFTVQQYRKFIKTGTLFDQQEDPSVWPEQAIICTCMQVTRGTITKACAEWL